jgi:PhoPQ-activated pathogenicity-related protein
MKRIVASLFSLIVLLGCSPSIPDKKSNAPINHLIDYVKDTTHFSYEIIETKALEGAMLFHIKMQSGKWLTEKEVDQPYWWHWLDVVVPNEIETKTALLFIGGGTKQDEKILIDSLSIKKALDSKSIIAHISNIPFQPLRFIQTDSLERYEDDLIAYGWDQFLSNGASPDATEWLARFPMTRAVVRGMDVIQALSKQTLKPVESFFISGASKRGWTTWTTAAVDTRVIGMAPLVIDLLNLEPSFEHHYRVYGEWSPAVKEYVDFDIMDWMGSYEFNQLMSYVEPYQFKDRFDLPKLIVNGTIDEFFVPDSWKFYWNDLPGANYLQYVPNGNHSLAGQYNTPNVFSFYHRLIYNEPLPNFNWKVEDGFFNLSLPTDVPYRLSLWQIHHPEKRDFRIWELGKSWVQTPIEKNSTGVYSLQAPSGTGYTASLVEVIFYPDSNNPLTLTSGTWVSPDNYPFPQYTNLNLKGTR